jgi:hypothetical protein
MRRALRRSRALSSSQKSGLADAPAWARLTDWRGKGLAFFCTNPATVRAAARRRGCALRRRCVRRLDRLDFAGLAAYPAQEDAASMARRAAFRWTHDGDTPDSSGSGGDGCQPCGVRPVPADAPAAATSRARPERAGVAGCGAASRVICRGRGEARARRGVPAGGDRACAGGALCAWAGVPAGRQRPRRAGRHQGLDVRACRGRGPSERALLGSHQCWRGR